MSHAETERAVALIRRLTDGRTLMIVEHEMSVVFGLADRISVLVYGQIIASGTPEEIRENPKLGEAYIAGEAASCWRSPPCTPITARATFCRGSRCISMRGRSSACS